ncbi:hypothetical protein D3C78_374650 [compost metagenome]
MSQAGFGRRAYIGIGFYARYEQAFEAGAGQRVAGFAEQAHSGQPYSRVGIHQLQVGQSQAQCGVNAFVLFALQLLVEEFQLRRLGTFL